MATKLGNLVNPEVLGQYLDVKLMDAIKFAPLCAVSNELAGKPGDTLTLPMYKFIGLAEDVPEGEDVTFGELGKETVDVKVKKAGRGVEVTDEAILSAYGDTVNEIGKQLLMAIAGKVDNDCVAAFRGASINADGEAVPVVEDAKITAARDKRKIDAGRKFDKYVISEMMAEFGEDIEEEMVAIINPAHLAELRRDADFVQVNHGEVIMNGEVGRLFGVRIVISNKVQETEVFLAKAGAVEILMKRNVMVEADRNIKNKTNMYVVDEHYAVYLKYPERIVIATVEK